MIIFKDNKLNVETPSEITLDGIYSAVICKVVQAKNDDNYICKLYIPEVYGEYDKYSITYPTVIIPYKQDSDDEGHVPEIGEVVKVSFDDGNSRSCRLLYVMPISTNSIAINKNYIENGVKAVDLILDINDPDILNKIANWLSDAYFVTTGKYEDKVNKDDFVYRVLCSFGPNDDTGEGKYGSIQNFFIKPLTMLLPTYNDYKGEAVSINYESTGYLLSELLIKLYRNAQSVIYSDKELMEFVTETIDFIKDNSPYGTAMGDINTDSRYIKFFIFAICAYIDSRVIPIFYPKNENSDNEVLESTFNNFLAGGVSTGPIQSAPFLWRMLIENEDHVMYEYLKERFSEFLYTYIKKDYEKRWQQACAAWISGINTLINNDEINSLRVELVKKAVCLCLTVCPWLTYTTFSNPATDINAYNNEEILNYLGISTETYYKLFYPNDDEFNASSKTIQDAIKGLDVINIVNAYKAEAKKIWGEAAWSIGYYEGGEAKPTSTWELEKMEEKFFRINEVCPEIVDTPPSDVNYDFSATI